MTTKQRETKPKHILQAQMIAEFRSFWSEAPRDGLKAKKGQELEALLLKWSKKIEQSVRAEYITYKCCGGIIAHTVRCRV